MGLNEMNINDAFAKRMKKSKLTGTESLKETYASFTIDELKELLRNYNVKGYSKLKKQELVDMVIETVMSSFSEMTGTLSVLHYELINNILEEERSLYIPEYGEDEFIYRGFATPYEFDNKAHLHFPAEIKDALKKYLASEEAMKDFLLQRKITRLVYLASYRYGVMKYDDLVDRVASVLAAELVTVDQVRDIITLNISNYMDLDIDTMVVSNILCEHPKEVFEEIQKNPKELVPLTLADSDALNEHDYLNVKEAEALLAFLQTKTSEYKAKDYLDVLYLLINYNQSELEIIDFFQNEIDFGGKKALSAFIDVLVPFMNSVPRWLLGGDVPKPVVKDNSQTFVSEKKVGRNDPCPCGSGKKYKKCCLNK